MFCYPASVISRFSVNCCRNPIIFNHHQYFWEIEVWSEFRHSRTKMKSSYPSGMPLPKDVKFGMSPGKWPKPWKRNFFWGGSHGKVLALGVLVICPVHKNRSSKFFFLLFAPNIRILRSKLNIFVPRSLFEPRRSMFSTQKRCLIGSLIWGYQKFCSLPKNVQIWHFDLNECPFGPVSNKKAMRTWWFSDMWVPKHLLPPK